MSLTTSTPTIRALKRYRRYGLAVILIFYVALSLLYDVTVPLFEKPDELKHFAVIQHIQSTHQLPVVQADIYHPWDQEGTQPPLYHILSAAASAWLNLDDFTEPPRNPHYADDRSFVWRERGNNNLYLHPPGETWRTDSILVAARIGRWLSIVFGLLSLTFTYLLAATVFPCTPTTTLNLARSDESNEITSNQYQYILCIIPILAVILMAFVPQYLHLSSAITNDSLAVTIAAASLLILARMVRAGISSRLALALGVAMGLGAITKLSLLYLVIPAALVFLLNYHRRRSLRRLLFAAAIIAGPLLLLSGWWFWRNWQLYGDPTALNAHLLYRGGPLNPTPTLAQIWQTEMVGLEISFWAAFGAGHILLEPAIYTGLSWLKYLVLAGLLLGAWQLFHQPPVPHQLPKKADTAILLGLLLIWCAVIFAALLRWMQITPASWGRLLYPALPALAVLAAWALVQFPLLAQRLKPAVGTPQKYVTGIFRFTLNAIPVLVPLALFVLAWLGPPKYINAAYAQTSLIAPDDLPPGVNRVDAVLADGDLQLLAYRIGQPTAKPGDWLPVTLYWRATQPIAANLSAFVHLLNPQGQSLAQSNSYPDGGNWPTSMLPPGRVLADTHYIFVPPDVVAPAETLLSLGLFNFDDPQRAALPAVSLAGEPLSLIVDGPPLLPQQWPLLQPSTPLSATFADQIQLIGLDWANNQPAAPGDTLPLALYWQTLAAPGRSLNLFIHLVEPDSNTQVAGFDGPPAFGTEFWEPGATFIDTRALTLPPDIAPGTYTLQLGWYNLDDFARLPLSAPAAGDALKIGNVTVK